APTHGVLTVSINRLAALTGMSSDRVESALAELEKIGRTRWFPKYEMLFAVDFLAANDNSENFRRGAVKSAHGLPREPRDAFFALYDDEGLPRDLDAVPGEYRSDDVQTPLAWRRDAVRTPSERRNGKGGADEPGNAGETPSSVSESVSVSGSVARASRRHLDAVGTPTELARTLRDNLPDLVRMANCGTRLDEQQDEIAALVGPDLVDVVIGLGALDLFNKLDDASADRRIFMIGDALARLSKRGAA
ncbi:MAG: hypothetical protein IT350_02255, partial [Deltaproteobacteria bacterium]|nr:hypothetical protein [Deltaproteobacteria bacterium]